MACESAVVPAQADIYSLQGIAQLSNTIDAVKKYCNSSLLIMGILLTRFSSRSIISREITEMIEQVAQRLDTKVFRSKIRECTEVHPDK